MSTMMPLGGSWDHPQTPQGLSPQLAQFGQSLHSPFMQGFLAAHQYLSGQSPSVFPGGGGFQQRPMVPHPMQGFAQPPTRMVAPQQVGPQVGF